VVVLGQTIVDNLFPAGVDPVGSTIRINRISYTVLGVLSTKGGGTGMQNQDNTALIPISTAQRRMMGVSHVSMLNVQVDTPENMGAVQANIEELLRQRHRISGFAPNDFSVSNMATVLEAVESTTAILTLFLAGVAAISLLVGGIGIMNIMLVSVTERTREIGLRMAVGATERDIRNQFLVEALALCIAGGIVGILLGVSGAKFIAAVTGWSTTVTPASILLSTGFAVAIGIFFGYYPAKKASGLDPIEALRFER
jgi:putative ABC transport system permease protein